MNPTLIVTTSLTSTVQVLTIPVAISPDRDNQAATVWSEQVFNAARHSNQDGARFLSGLYS